MICCDYVITQEFEISCFDKLVKDLKNIHERLKIIYENVLKHYITYGSFNNKNIYQLIIYARYHINQLENIFKNKNIKKVDLINNVIDFQKYLSGLIESSPYYLKKEHDTMLILKNIIIRTTIPYL